MATQPHAHGTTFTLALNKFKSSLSDTEKQRFSATTLKDLEVALQTIQQKQTSDRKARAMGRLGCFLEGMKEYDKIVTVFLNTSELLAFVWGPMKFLLQVASTFYEAFDTLLEAYQRIGDHIHLLKQYEIQLQKHPEMRHPLRLIYEDILEFHWKAMKFFKKRGKQQLFRALWKTFEFEFGHILRDIREHMSLVRSHVNIAQFTEVLKTQELAKLVFEGQLENEKHRRREVVRQWLSAPNCDADQETLVNIRSKYQGTGQWLLQEPQFISWFNAMHCSLHQFWINGIPGAGKTVLTSLVVEEARKLKQQGISIIFFYCKYLDKDRSTFIGLARGLLSQLLAQDDSLLPYLHEKACTTGQPLSVELVAREVLELSIKSSGKLYVIIDGLDECERDERKQIVTFFEDLWVSLPPDEKDSLRCLFVSQDDNIARKDFANMSSLKITESHTRKDIRSYAAARSLEIQLKFELPADRQLFIQELIVDKAEGMFLFARLMTSFLLDQTSIASLDDELAPGKCPQGPSRLDQIYSRIVQRLSLSASPSQSGSLKLLTWMICAKRPLKWHEIQCAVSVDMENQCIDWERKRFRVDSKELCGSLVEIHTNGEVNLVHHTAKRYLIDQDFVDVGGGELALALLCVGYLSFPGFTPGIHDAVIQDFIPSGYYGFFDYAYAYWSRHIDAYLRLQRPINDLEELREAADVFVDMHWTKPRTRTIVPKSFLDRWKPVSESREMDKLLVAGYLSQRQLNASAKQEVDDQVLGLHGTISKARACLESMWLLGLNSGGASLRAKYGVDIYKCPRVNCTRFYNGFSTRHERDDHVPKHERSFFCTFAGCAMFKLGCATMKELQRHENDYHGSFNLDDGEPEYPEMPAEKVSFQCNQCDAKFTRNNNLKIHMRKHNAPNEKAFICAQCGKSFARLGDRTRHESTTHSGAKTFTCGGVLKDGGIWGCGREFNRGDMLSRHWKSGKGEACIAVKRQEEEKQRSDMSTSIQSASAPSSGT